MPSGSAAGNALRPDRRYDVVADGSDNFATRYLVSDACFLARKPLVTAAVGTFDGTLTTIRAHERAADGTPNPTYRCLFPEPPPPGTVPACAEAGVLGALVGDPGLDDGARGDPRDRRLRRRSGRTAGHGRRALDAFRDAGAIAGIRPIRSTASSRRSANWRCKAKPPREFGFALANSRRVTCSKCRRWCCP